MKNKQKMIWPLLAAVILIVVGFFMDQSSVVSPDEIKSVLIGGQRIKVDLAATSGERQQGLSGRASLPQGTGLLFVFERPDIYPFWMKDMNFPIDIIWLAPLGGGNNAKVSYIKKDARPESYPETFTPREEAMYVLEVPAGFSDKYGIGEGDIVTFLR